MTVLSPTRIPLLLAALLAWAGAATAAEPTLPAGVDAKAAKPIKKPGIITGAWKAILACANPPVYKASAGDEKLDGKAAFGDLAYVFHQHAEAGKPTRLLLGRFDEDAGEFKGWLGWVDSSYVADDDKPLKVDDARKALLQIVPKGHPFHARINEALPDASRADYKNVTLKAVTHPERGKACFSRPVSSADYEKESKTPDAVALQPFAFFYVYNLAVSEKNVYCLLGTKSTISLDEGNAGEKFRQNQLVGWVDIESLILWCTREAFEYHLEKAPLSARRKVKKPIELFAQKKDMLDWASWELDGRKGESPVKPVYTELLDEDKAPDWMKKPWNPKWMRYPILSSY
ncbi:MAG: hypothetical protein K2W96_05530, partial [Gemmataceae bacterium]|nr:hypothetical protein [Gemmataceae bacterium]